jgi:hypothetical protein
MLPDARNTDALATRETLSCVIRKPTGVDSVYTRVQYLDELNG